MLIDSEEVATMIRVNHLLYNNKMTETKICHLCDVSLLYTYYMYKSCKLQGYINSLIVQ